MSLNIQIIQKFKELIPKLHRDMHKGQSGRIAIVGGSRDYSGAPYFSCMAALRAGADLTYLLTTKDAAPVIKSYSPELIVLPVLDSDDKENEIKTLINRIHSLIIGPGLGRTDSAFDSVKTALKYAKLQNIPIVIDADGLYLLADDTSLVNGYEKCILTPNQMEFKRLYDKSFSNEDQYDEAKNYSTLESQCEAVRKLAAKLNNVTILKKGKVDIISNGKQIIYNERPGSLKRCGGLGDLLTGTIGVFSYWCNSAVQKEACQDVILNQANLVAAYSASVFIKECSKFAFEKYHRSVLAVDVIEQISETFYNMFDK